MHAAQALMAAALFSANSFAGKRLAFIVWPGKV
jgi:hypothetical protein